MPITARRLSRMISSLVVLAVAGMFATACGPQASTETSTPPPVASPTGTATPADDDDTSDAQPALTVTRDQEVRLTDPSQNSVHCDGGGEVYVQFAGSVTITGSCEEVDITAGAATVTLERSSDVDIESSGNQVDAVEIGDLDIDGDSNSVTVGTVREIDVEGTGNTVRFGAGSPSIEVEGQDNTVTPG